MSIDSSDISVVIQGAVDPALLKHCVTSVREKLPHAEIILSTWDGTSVEDAGLFDQIVYSADPGARPISKGGALNNTNRQIVSTLNGLKASTRPYSLKFRTDCKLSGTGFLEAFDNYPVRHDAFKLFQRKIVAPRFASRIETGKRPYLFHPADIALFGLTTDLVTLFDVPLVNAEQFNWVENSPDQSVRSYLKSVGMHCQLVPEQHLFIHALRHAGFMVDLPHPHAHTPELIQISRALLVNNYIVIADKTFGIHHLKKKLQETIPADSTTCYSVAQYEYVYKMYFAPDFHVGPLGRIMGKSILNFQTIEGLLKHGTRTLAYTRLGLASFHKVIAEFFITVYWLLRCTVILVPIWARTKADARLPIIRRVDDMAHSTKSPTQ